MNCVVCSQPAGKDHYRMSLVAETEDMTHGRREVVCTVCFDYVAEGMQLGTREPLAINRGVYVGGCKAKGCAKAADVIIDGKFLCHTCGLKWLAALAYQLEISKRATEPKGTNED